MDATTADKPLQLSDFDLDIPEELIAQYPSPQRGDDRLMVVNRQTGQVATHRFDELPDFLRAGDVLVLNDTRVLPARLFATRKIDNARVELLLVREVEHDSWETLVKPGKKAQVGEIRLIETI